MDRALDITREVVAFHEAGHAVVLHVAGAPVGRVTIVPTADGQQLGSVQTPGFGLLEYAQAHILCCYAGGHAVRRLDPAFGDARCEVDDAHAHRLLHVWGWTEYEHTLRTWSRAAVDKHWSAIEAIAAELLRVETMDGDAVIQIVDAATCTP